MNQERDLPGTLPLLFPDRTSVYPRHPSLLASSSLQRRPRQQRRRPTVTDDTDVGLGPVNRSSDFSSLCDGRRPAERALALRNSVKDSIRLYTGEDSSCSCLLTLQDGSCTRQPSHRQRPMRFARSRPPKRPKFRRRCRVETQVKWVPPTTSSPVDRPQHPSPHPSKTKRRPLTSTLSLISSPPSLLVLSTLRLSPHTAQPPNSPFLVKAALK